MFTPMTPAGPTPTTQTREELAPPGTLRFDMDQRHANGQRYSLREVISLLVPLCVDLAEHHTRGEKFAVTPSVIRLASGSRVTLILAAARNPPKLVRDRACIAPEERAGRGGDARSTVFSVGAMMYELLTGQSVGPGMRRPKDLVPELPDAVETILGKALIGDPQHRPGDLGALAQALHHMSPAASEAPPPADETALDGSGDLEVDVSLSLMPPPPKGKPQPAFPRQTPLPNDLIASAGVSTDGLVAVASAPMAEEPQDPTARLADLKARLESDPRPRYVVIKMQMDHGPFTAIELLQQIASHTFEEDHILVDTFSNDERPIRDWDEFAPFAEQAKLNREIVAEKKEIERVVVAETKATHRKALVIASITAGVVVAGIILFLTVRKFVRRAEVVVQSDEAISIETDAGIRGATRKGPGGGTWSGGPGGGHPVLRGGMSCEQAMDTYVTELKMAGNKPDLSANAYGAVLNNGSYVIGCGAPMSMTVSICAAVQNGRAVGVTVSTDPPNAGVASCISGRVRGMSFPSHPALDVTRTVFKGQ